MKTQKCPKCGEEKGEEGFQAWAWGKKGKPCRECSNNYYKENKKEILKQKKRYYQKNKEEITKYKRKYHLKNRKKIARKKFLHNKKIKRQNRGKNPYSEKKFKRCCWCKENLRSTDFAVASTSLDGLYSSCKICTQTRRHIYKGKRLFRQDKITMYKYQRGKCAVCQIAFIINGDSHIDHCHKSKNVRGLLCAECNKYIISQWDKNNNRWLKSLINSKTFRRIQEYSLNPPADRALSP